MVEIAPRWPCPVCLGVAMQKTPIGSARELLVDHCPRCGGVWFDLGEVQRLRQYSPTTFWATIPQRDVVARVQCHACHAFTERDAERCSACGRQTRFDCPACQTPMRQARYGALTLDVCERCKGVWFDHHELSAIWRIEWDRAARRLARRRRSSLGLDAGSLLLDALTSTPDALFYGADAAGHIAAASVDTVGMLASAGDMVVEAAVHVFEALIEIVAGIFS